ncbi:hypothetical protein P0D91_18750 [Pseudomonas sp. CBSPBW29]|uniref:hypothetical protein n=1 Tax=Pseudomonas TaxID=286 RepID=UPI0021AC97E8|nr:MULTISPECIES: hypothetical protein [unclassified Pseudomonas]WEL40346.1 hypothetical protein P0D91_18750 [Pseudomonas sp. CBSPBW29]WEL67092.1 hypothetical protein P0D93_12910 [Pseudomonas sp. CBSPGW29]WEL77515.1 hypothetical protein P0D92_04850 [Pseudomonas sp. CBSPAW29]WEL83857.1 hypothetical protein P0D95_07535 [Pseudomonas sp. CBSPCAW29]WEL86703.1 hypothetical protein P0D90_23240 [Pseudomonas sp. CBSPCBW29]
MPNPNDEFPHIIAKTRNQLLNMNFPSIDRASVAKYFPADPYKKLEVMKAETFDIDLQKMKTEDPDLYREVADFLKSNCNISFNAYCSEEQVSNSNSLLDYSYMVAQTSDINKYFRN